MAEGGVWEKETPMYITAVTPFLVDPGTGKNWLLVKVDTSDGISGWGECYTQADRDQSIVAHVRQLGRYLVERSSLHIKHLVWLPRSRPQQPCPTFSLPNTL
jgi:L-alanine-DL-glutamate epimerase-like enolase superfamily enzyme